MHEAIAVAVISARLLDKLAGSKAQHRWGVTAASNSTARVPINRMD